MVLSNTEILSCIKSGAFEIENLGGEDPGKAPFNTSAVDLRLGPEINIFDGNIPASFDLRKGGIAHFLSKHSKRILLTEDQPYNLKNAQLVLGQTIEKVRFPINSGRSFCARVEGKSSLARCGILVHFTAPTIHSGFYGPITLEIINFGPLQFGLYPGMYFCQLIIEEVAGTPTDAPNQFKGQEKPTGVRQTE